MVLAGAAYVSAAGYASSGIQGYAADTPLDIGTVVQLTGEDGSRVIAATKKDLPQMFGVVIDRNTLSFTITSESLENEVFVAPTGTYNTLVSTEGGTIRQGDYVTMSSVDGVVMKAGTEEKTVFGRAGAGFDGKDIVVGTTTLKDTSGNNQTTVTLGSIPVTIDIKRNPNDKSTKADVPEFLQRLGQQIAEKKVSPIRIYLSMAITTVSLIAAIAVLYAGVRNSVIAIGRNPMSKKSIFRALFEIILTAILILIIGLFAVYLLLKL
ncbi:MAG: hypothetical protein WAS27_01605 [Candidatus Saccharimonadales bacterium]